MKKTFITGFILCSFGVLYGNLSAQEYNSFDLSKYYTPDIVRNRLDLSFNGGSSFNNQISSTDSVYYNTLNWTLSPNFEMYKNTRKVISLFQVNGIFQGQSSGNGNLNNNDNSFVATQSANRLNITYNVRFYNPGKQFLSFRINGNFETSGNMNHFTNYSVKTKAGNQNFDGALAPSFGLGFGRIESVEDARQAIYILEELSKKGALTRLLSNEEVFKLSQQISRVKNKRFLDSRLHLIDEITSIDSFFVSNNLLTKSDASYFTTLYDNWQYGALYSRKAGKEFEVRLFPTVSLSSDNRLKLDSLQWEHGSSNYYGGGLSITYNYEKPVNLNWQHSANATFNFISVIYDETTLPELGYPSVTRKYMNSDAYLLGSYYIKYYPSTRTNFSAGLLQTFDLNRYVDIPRTTTTDTFFSSTAFNFDASYYFSPQFRLSGRTYINYYLRNSDTFKTSGLRGGISASLIYSFF